MFRLTIGNLTASISLPSEWRERIVANLAPFLSEKANGDGDRGAFEVKPVSGNASLNAATGRAGIYYKENGVSDFEVGGIYFRLYIELEARKGTLYISEAAVDQSSIIFNSIKWFMTYHLISDGAVPLHSSLIACPPYGGALFCGPSGSGKSTIARILSGRPDLFRRGSDELNFVFESGAAIMGAPTPFTSSGGQGNITDAVDLKRIFFLRHSSITAIEIIDTKRSFREMLKNVYTQPLPRILAEKLLSSLELISVSVQCGIFHFRNDDSAIETIYSEFENYYEPALQP